MRGRIPLGVLIGAALVAAVGAAGVMWAMANNSGSAGETARLIPADATLYASINTDATSRQWAQTAILLSRLGLDDDLRRARDEGASGEGLSWEEDIAPFLGGEASIALLGSSIDNPDVIGVLSTRDGERAWRKTVKTLDEQAGKDGAQADVRSYRDTEIRTYEQGSGPPLSIARRGAYLIAATRPELVQTSLDLEGGKGDSLAGLDRFKSARGAVADDPLVFMYVNPAASTDLAEALAGSATFGATDNPFRSGDLSRAAIGLALSAEDKGLRLEVQTVGLVRTRGAQSGATAPDESRFAIRAPADSLLFVWGRELWKGSDHSLKDIIDGLNKNADTQAIGQQLEDGVQQLKRELGFDFEADLLNQLRGEYAFALGATSLNGDDVWALAMASVRDADTVARSLVKIAQYEQRQGRQTSTTPIGGVDITESRERKGGPVQWAYGLTGDELLAGFGRDALRRAIERRDSLADDPDFQEARETLPGGRTFAVFVNLKRIIDLARQSGEADDFLDSQAASRLRYITAAVTQKNDRAGFVTFLRIADK